MHPRNETEYPFITLLHEDELLIESDRLGLSAWLNRRLMETRGTSTSENLLEWQQEWRHFNPYDSRGIPQTPYAFPKGFLEKDGTSALASGSKGCLRCEHSREERAIRRGSSLPKEAFRQAAREIVEWARLEDRLFPNDLRDLVGASGQEFDVLLIEGRVLKFTKKDEAGKTIGFRAEEGPPELMPAWPSEFLKRIDLANLIFNDDIRLEGASIGSYGEISFVVSQKTLSGVIPHRSEIIAQLQTLGFLKINDPKNPGAMEFYHPDIGIAIFDAQPRNLLKSSSGEIVPFDIIPVEPDQEAFIAWLQKHTPELNGN